MQKLTIPLINNYHVLDAVFLLSGDIVLINFLARAEVVHCQLQRLDNLQIQVQAAAVGNCVGGCICSGASPHGSILRVSITRSTFDFRLSTFEWLNLELFSDVYRTD